MQKGRVRRWRRGQRGGPSWRRSLGLLLCLLRLLLLSLLLLLRSSSLLLLLLLQRRLHKGCLRVRQPPGPRLARAADQHACNPGSIRQHVPQPRSDDCRGLWVDGRPFCRCSGAGR